MGKRALYPASKSLLIGARPQSPCTLCRIDLCMLSLQRLQRPRRSDSQCGMCPETSATVRHHRAALRELMGDTPAVGFLGGPWRLLTALCRERTVASRRGLLRRRFVKLGPAGAARAGRARRARACVHSLALPRCLDRAPKGLGQCLRDAGITPCNSARTSDT